MIPETQPKRPRWSFFLITALAVIVGVILVLSLLEVAVSDVFSNISTSDCGWSRTVQTWVDADGDGLRDDDERPLANVTLYVDDIGNNFEKVGTGITDQTGTVRLQVFLPGCPALVAMETYPQLPTAYCLTTPERIRDGDTIPSHFGFVSC